VGGIFLYAVRKIAIPIESEIWRTDNGEINRKAMCIDAGYLALAPAPTHGEGSGALVIKRRCNLTFVRRKTRCLSR